MQKRILRIEEVITVPIGVAGILLIVGAIGVGVGQPWLIPSVAPTAYLQVKEPEMPMSQPYKVVTSHLLGLGVGVAAFEMFGLEPGRSIFEVNQVITDRLWATVTAVALVELLALVVNASHAPASSTAAMITLSGFAVTWPDWFGVVAGVLGVAFFGELVRQFRLRQVRRMREITKRHEEQQQKQSAAGAH